VKGKFEGYDGTLELYETPAIKLTIDAASLNTNNKKRDTHARHAANRDRPGRWHRHGARSKPDDRDVPERRRRLRSRAHRRTAGLNATSLWRRAAARAAEAAGSRDARELTRVSAMSLRFTPARSTSASARIAVPGRQGVSRVGRWRRSGSLCNRMEEREDPPRSGEVRVPGGAPGGVGKHAVAIDHDRGLGATTIGATCANGPCARWRSRPGGARCRP
jgi:hypothetical protein